MQLYIGNKNYSSWSLRPWIAMRAKGIEFEEKLIPFDDKAGNPAIRAISPHGKVPLLVDGDQKIWESLAILEYVAERFSAAMLWPEDQKLRAHARSVANEMHGGFGALRSAAPMNIRREVRPLPVNEDVARDVARIENIWEDCLSKYGGPFLFGEFTNADAMYAPVVNRLEVYVLSDNEGVRAYSAAMKALPAWQEWEAAARAESWIVEEDEV